MNDHEVWDELAAGYALDALATDEERVFVDHLADCERCTRSVDEHALTAAQLGALAHHDESAELPSWSAMRLAVLADDHDDDGDKADAAPVVDLTARRRRRYDLSRRTLAAAAGVAVLVGGGVAAWRVTSGGPGTPSQVAACQSTAGCHVVALRSSSGNTTEASVLVNDSGSMVVVPQDLKTARAGQQYVLWQFARDGRPTPVDEFTATGSHATTRGTIEVPYSDLLELAISSEPASQVPTKPSKIVAVGTTTT